MTDTYAGSMIKFFCPVCGHEMWKMVGWNSVRCYSQNELRVLLLCSDCILEEIRADRAKEKAHDDN